MQLNLFYLSWKYRCKVLEKKDMYIFHRYHNFARQIHQTFENKTKQKLFLPSFKRFTKL